MLAIIKVMGRNDTEKHLNTGFVGADNQQSTGVVWY